MNENSDILTNRRITIIRIKQKRKVTAKKNYNVSVENY